MKYIRTADGRIVDTEKEYQPLEWAKEARDYALTEREADTIEELCDEFVMVNKTKEIIDHRLVYDIDFSKDKFVLNKYEVFGAIWTDKGLIYVAKMNDEGNLELI